MRRIGLKITQLGAAIVLTTAMFMSLGAFVGQGTAVALPAGCNTLLNLGSAPITVAGMRAGSVTQYHAHCNGQHKVWAVVKISGKVLNKYKVASLAAIGTRGGKSKGGTVGTKAITKSALVTKKSPTRAIGYIVVTKKSSNAVVGRVTVTTSYV